jgi:hypothetical protein
MSWADIEVRAVLAAVKNGTWLSTADITRTGQRLNQSQPSTSAGIALAALRRLEKAGEVERNSDGKPTTWRLEAMIEKVGTLRKQPPGRWAVCRPDRIPAEVTAGKQFRIEVPRGGGLKLTRMEYRQSTGPLAGRDYPGQLGEYYTTSGYPLHDGLRAALLEP